MAKHMQNMTSCFMSKQSMNLLTISLWNHVFLCTHCEKPDLEVPQSNVKQNYNIFQLRFTLINVLDLNKEKSQYIFVE
jgi:hypothetical protein